MRDGYDWQASFESQEEPTEYAIPTIYRIKDFTPMSDQFVGEGRSVFVVKLYLLLRLVLVLSIC